MGWGNPCKEYLRNIVESLRKITVCCLRDWKQLAWESRLLQRPHMKCPKARDVRETDLTRALLGQSVCTTSYAGISSLIRDRNFPRLCC